MRFTNLALGILVIFLFSVTTLGQEDIRPENLCSEFKKMTRAELNQLYINGRVQSAPEGEFVSCELARPDLPGNSILRWLADFSWNGMNYVSDGNRVEVYLTKLNNISKNLHIKAVGTYGLEGSFFDNGLSFVNEYKSVEIPRRLSLLPGFFTIKKIINRLPWALRDEFREIRPGVYLGMTYGRIKLPRGRVGSEYIGTIAIINKELFKDSGHY